MYDSIFYWIKYIFKSTIFIPRFIYTQLIRGSSFLYSNSPKLVDVYNNTTIPDISFIFVSFILFSLGIFVYIKLIYPFWSCQPVFHSYDFWRYLYSKPFIIRDIPMTTKFYDILNIRTMKYLEIDQDDLTKIIDFLRCKYIPSDRILYTLTATILNAYMKGNIEPSFFSIYSPIYAVSNSPNTQPILGVISSRPIQLHFLENGHSKMTIPAYYLDIICSDKNEYSFINGLLGQDTNH